MSQYRITATITSQTQATDSGAWQMGITWRKSLTLDPAETQEAADLRNQAWEQAANGIDDETTRRIWQQVDTVTAREAERLRAQARKLIGLLNAGRPALDENGYPMWDHLIALSKRMMTTIKVNMTFSMALNFVAIVLAINGTLNPVVGALVHNAGSVLVITCSAFLLKWKRK